MQHPARIEAVIALLEFFIEKLKNHPEPIEIIIKKYFRKRRYAGAGDRRAITAMVFELLRHWQGYQWLIERQKLAFSARTLVITHLARAGDKSAPETGLPAAQSLFGGEGYGPEALNAPELALIDAVTADSGAESGPGWLARAPAHVRANLPSWLYDTIHSSAPDLERWGSPGERPHFDLRVNSLKSTRDEVMALLAADGIEARPTPYAPLGLRLDPGQDLRRHAVLQTGLAEIQDESGQIAAHLTGAGPGEQVLDLCAGAGGKALAMAAAMAGKGQIYAFDSNEARLRDLPARAARAKAHNIQWQGLAPVGPARTAALAPLEGRMDRVIIDAPCSGTGTLRRHPDLALRLSPDAPAEYAKLQLKLLFEGAGLLKASGRLVYMTCSLLLEENEAVAKAFLRAHPDYRVKAYRDIMAEHPLDETPLSQSGLEGALLLTPWQHDTDGFFVIAFEHR